MRWLSFLALIPGSHALSERDQLDAAVGRWGRRALPVTGRLVGMLARSGNLELLVAEVGDQLKGAAEGGDVAFRTSWVETSPRSIWETQATETPIRTATCSWVTRAACASRRAAATAHAAGHASRAPLRRAARRLRVWVCAALRLRLSVRGRCRLPSHRSPASRGSRLREEPRGRPGACEATARRGSAFRGPAHRRRRGDREGAVPG